MSWIPISKWSPSISIKSIETSLSPNSPLVYGKLSSNCLSDSLKNSLLLGFTIVSSLNFTNINLLTTIYLDLLSFSLFKTANIGSAFKYWSTFCMSLYYWAGPTSFCT